MMKKRKLIAGIMALVLVFQSNHTYVDAGQDSKLSLQLNYSNTNMVNNEKMIYDSMTIIPDQDWQKWAGFFAPELRQEYIDFVSDSNNEINHVGIFAVETGTVQDILKFNLDEVPQYYEIGTYLNMYDAVEAYLVAVDYSLKDKSDYYFDGINYRLVIIAESDSNWYKVAESHCTEDLLEKADNKLKKDAVNELDKRQRQYIAKTGGEAEDSEGGISIHAGVTSPYGRSQPRYIKIKRKTQPGEPVVQVQFELYVRVVLGCETYPSWHMEALKACAMAVKMYAWYYMIYPKYPLMGYDLLDTSKDQKYDPTNENALHSNIKAAVRAIMDKGFLNSEGKFMCSHHKTGTKDLDPFADQKYPACGGTLSQWGAQYLASKRNASYEEILDFYYSYSGSGIEQSLEEIFFFGIPGSFDKYK